MKIILVLLFSFIMCVNVYGQSHIAALNDSILRVIPLSEDTVKIKLYKKLAWENRSFQPNKAIQWANDAIAVAEKSKKKELIPDLYNLIGIASGLQGNYAIAIGFHLKAQQLAEKYGDKLTMAFALNNSGSLFIKQKNFEQALTNLKEGNELFKQVGNEKGIAYGNHHIASALIKMKKFNQALPYEQKALDFRLQSNDKIGIAYSYHNIGLIHQGNKEYDKAAYLFHKALPIFEEKEQKVGLSTVLNSLAEISLAKEEFKEAIKFAEKGIEISKSIDDKEDLSNAYRTISFAYRGLKQFDKAYNYQLIFSVLKEELNDEARTRQVNEVQAIFDHKHLEKETQDLRLKEAEHAVQIKQQQYVGILVGLILVVVLIFSLLLFRNFRKERKDRQEIVKQKEEINLQNLTLHDKQKEIEQTNAKLEQQNKKITDSIRYAQTIQHALLPSEKLALLFPNNFIIYQPKDIVSGDFFWIGQVENQTIIALADCTGHGVPGAFMSLVGMALLNQIVVEEHLLSPSDILTHLNDGLIKVLSKEHNNNSDGMDIAICIIERKENENSLCYAGASMPIYVYDNAEKNLMTLKPNRFHIGGSHKKQQLSFSQKSFQSNKPFAVYIASDGYSDQNNQNREKYGSKRIQEKIIEANLLPFSEQRTFMENDLKTFKYGTEQRDDMSLIAFLVE